MEALKSLVAIMPALPSISMPDLPDIVKNKMVWAGIGVTILVLLATIWFFRKGASAASPKLVPAEVAKDIKYDIYLDVRTKEEIDATGDLPGSLHVPLDEIHALKSQLHQNAHILVYCNTGRRAKHAATELIKMGFEHVEYTDAPYTALLKEEEIASATVNPEPKIEHVE